MTTPEQNKVRRRKYRTDPDYRDRAKQRSMESYRKKHPKKESKIKKGLLLDGYNCEVVHMDIGAPFFEVAYTLPRAAEALGKSVLTFKRYIREKLIPPPILVDTSRGFAVYSEKELQLIAGCLKEHESMYDYLHVTHETTINCIWQAIEAYRRGVDYGDEKEGST